ncbi:MAG: tRNA 4-thiouridine(8) synthase ThiI [Candidatus Kapabacteria bacterium]|nr:tRNA 4-thiouridine(8) synthase ThiI [Candidatus Kapabacteria bacterium]MDW8011464.1 tRNA uracil 4-sulfurtransferase ThiI [Bacteroidota bacterium]
MQRKPRPVLLAWLFHEIALKGNNRRLFLQTALRNIRKALNDLPASVTYVPPMAVRIHCDPSQIESVRKRLLHVVGVESVALALRSKLSWEALVEATDTLLDQLPPFASFAVRCKRTEKRFPLSSAEIERQLGAHIAERVGARVDLQTPEKTLWVRLLPDGCYVYTERLPGMGGLPVGVSGHVLALLSGGIDSPVAAWRMMLRGCSVDFVHFHSFPLVSRRSQEKVEALAEVLTRYQYRSRLFLVPIAEFQQHVVVLAPPSYRVILYRRFMLRLAQQIARRYRAQALVTGESLGQVSSQTLDNLATISAVAELPILRPLIGMSKQEIIAQARQLGTYELSIQPDEDCCSLFVPRHSVTRSDPATVADIETQLPLETLLQHALQETRVVEFSFPRQGTTCRTTPPPDAAATPAVTSPANGRAQTESGP